MKAKANRMKYFTFIFFILFTLKMRGKREKGKIFNNFSITFHPYPLGIYPNKMNIDNLPFLFFAYISFPLSASIQT